MFDTFKYTTLSLVRSGGILIWALVFPIVLSTCFVFMFSGLDSVGDLHPIRTIVVTDGAYDDSVAFKTFAEALGGGADDDEGESSSDDGVTLEVEYVDDEQSAIDMMIASEGEENPYAGYITVPSVDEPSLHVQGASSMQSAETVNRSILVTLMDTFTSRVALVRQIIDDDPTTLANPELMESVYGIPEVTEKVDVTADAPKESVRYYFALMGMAALFGAQVALVAVLGLLPNMGPLGARRAISGVSHASALTGTILASWLVSFACLVVAYGYIRIVCGVDFAGRDGMAMLIMAVSSLMATSLGSGLAVIPKIPDSAKGGILTGIVCFAALFAGLYGQPTMELADTVAAAFPPSELINPAVQISQAFFSLMYYDTLSPCFEHLGVLLIMCVILFVLSARSLRRQRYASL